MYINIYKAEPYNYIDKNFKTIEEVKDYLHITDKLDLFSFVDSDNIEYFAEYKKWTITIKEGEIPDEGEGYVSMLEESGALDELY